MWVHKTPDEIGKEDDPASEPVSLPRALLGATVVAVLIFIIAVGAILSPKGRSAGWLTGRLSGTQIILIGAALSLTGWLAAFLWQVIYRRPALFFTSASGKVVICNRCYRVKTPDGDDHCGCGGEFEDFALWKWVDE